MHAASSAPGRAWLSVISVAGMICVLPAAAFFFWIGLLWSGGVFENVTPQGEAAGTALAEAAAVAGVGAIVALFGFVARSRLAVAAGGLGVAVAAGALAVAWVIQDWQMGRNDTDLLLGLMLVAGVGLLALSRATRGALRRD